MMNQQLGESTKGIWGIYRLQEVKESFASPDYLFYGKTSENIGSQHFQKYFCCKVLFFAKLQR